MPTYKIKSQNLRDFLDTEAIKWFEKNNKSKTQNTLTGSLSSSGNIIFSFCVSHKEDYAILAFYVVDRETYIASTITINEVLQAEKSLITDFIIFNINEISEA